MGIHTVQWSHNRASKEEALKKKTIGEVSLHFVAQSSLDS